ncbi:MAG TPA: acylphosphatase [Flavitalea sp.]|nr:acylphosphatase [Flavitalea sp.]
MNETIQIVVTGTVQGVYFRQSAKEKALTLGIKGTVKNIEDGSVSITASGEHKNLQKLIDWCCIGPSHAEVENVHVEKVPYVHFSEFNIIRG